MAWPLAFFFTWSCYGQRLHGDPAGSVGRFYDELGKPFVPENDGLQKYERDQLAHGPTVLSAPMRRVVRNTLVERCDYIRTPLIALNVRTTHVHLIVEAQQDSGKLAGGFKARSTRVLRETGLVAPTHHVWADHGSKRWLFTLDAIRHAMEYVLHDQGQPDEFAVRGTRY
jgi:REP element-mobilizing transposase RayT